MPHSVAMVGPVQLPPEGNDNTHIDLNSRKLESSIVLCHGLRLYILWARLVHLASASGICAESPWQWKSTRSVARQGKLPTAPTPGEPEASCHGSPSRQGQAGRGRGQAG